MSEREDADRLAEKLLEQPYADPDDNLRMLSRQLLRRNEVIERLKKDLAAQMDPTLDLIHANRDTILRMHEEAVRRIQRVIESDRFGDVCQMPRRCCGRAKSMCCVRREEPAVSW